MSPRVKVTREQWIAAALQLLAQGHVLLDLSLSELCSRMEVTITKGSFYSHFPGGDEEFHRAVIARWLEQADLDALASTIGAVRDPRDRLRLLRARAHDRAGLDSTMRQWARRDSAAAAAVGKADDAVTGHAGQALEDLGYPPDEVWVLGPLVSQAVVGASLGPADFETLLGVLARAVPAHPRVEVVGSDPDRTILLALMPHLSPDAVADLRTRAQRFADQHRGDAAPPRPELRSAGGEQPAGA
jgi:AcrR family transcriptional regulator